MSLAIQNQELPDRSPLTTAIGAMGATLLVAKLLVGRSLKQGFVVGLCAELSARIAIYAVQYFTQLDTVSRTAARAGRLLGGVLLGNVILQTAGFVPLALTASSFILPLAGMVYTDIADYIAHTSS